MPIEMPRGLPFSVDTWTPISNRKRHHFLTHAHKDHFSGILTHSSYPIYCTSFTKSLILHIHPQLENSLFVDVKVGQSVVLNDPDGKFVVTAFDANHCPGAVMFLFEGNFGNILHTGDCRLTSECLLCLPEKYMSKKGQEPRCRLDCVFLDCTFGNFHQRLPSKHLATQQVINCIWKHPAAAVVYLTCDLLGQENILAEVSKTFGSKIYVDKDASPECFKTLTLTYPQIICQDPTSRFHLFGGFPKLRERSAAKFAEAKSNCEPDPLIIRPSAQWYACEEEGVNADSQNKRRYNEAVRDDCGIWHVCYSIHSSREELEWALKLLAPKWVVSTTPSCRAIELEYVRKLSSSTQLSKGNPIWKLLGISLEASVKVDVSSQSINNPSKDEGPSHISSDFHRQQPPVDVSYTDHLFSLSPPSKRPAVTLFGRARLCISGSKKTVTFPESCSEISEKIDEEAAAEVEYAVKSENKMENKETVFVAAEHSEKSLEKEAEEAEACSPVGSSRKLSETLIKLYRSMNVPVPRPLPSLLELRGYSKQNKRRIEFLS